MAGEPFYLPNFGNQSQGLNLGLGNFGQSQTIPNWNMSWMSPGASPMSGPVNPMQARFNQINQQMAPNHTLGYLNAGIQGASTLGNLAMGIYALSQSRQAAKWQQGMAEKNYANSISSYNTAMEDKVRSRYDPQSYANNRAAIDAEIQKRKLGVG